MAGAKQSPRQKMISLMYLVLLAMLAMQVSVEVMDAFGRIYQKNEVSNEIGEKKNEDLLASLGSMAKENSQFEEPYAKSQKVNELTLNLVKALQEVQDYIKKEPNVAKELKENGELPAQAMGKPDYLDEYFFKGEVETKNGKKFVKAIEDYRNGMLAIIPDGVIAEEVQKFFSTGENGKVTVGKKGDTRTMPWLTYSFKGFPLIGSMAQLSNLESSALMIENEALTQFLSGRALESASAKNLKAIVISSKTAYFAGEKFEGEVLLASKDASKVPNSAKINGKELDLKDAKVFDNGLIKLNFPTGSVGENDVKGTITFIENGKEVTIDVESKYAVVPRPNGAVVSADKMNVVYRGIDNPITISMPGVNANKINASTPGLRKVNGTKYNLIPGRGKEVTINVNGTTDDGVKITSAPVKFRIKDIPATMVSIRKEFGSVKMPKASLAKSTVEAGLPDFLFDLKFNVISFKVKVPGQTTVLCNGNRMNSDAKRAIGRAKRGDIVTIFGMKAKIQGKNLKLKEALPLSVEISN